MNRRQGIRPWIVAQGGYTEGQIAAARMETAGLLRHVAAFDLRLSEVAVWAYLQGAQDAATVAVQMVHDGRLRSAGETHEPPICGC